MAAMPEEMVAIMQSTAYQRGWTQAMGHVVEMAKATCREAEVLPSVMAADKLLDGSVKAAYRKAFE